MLSREEAREMERFEQEVKEAKRQADRQENPQDVAAASMQKFASGATRNTDVNKFDYEGFINPEVLHAFGEYMHAHRRQNDGSLRDSDNWQKGIPLRTYMKSLIRHAIDLWRMERGFTVINPDTGLPHTKQELCCALMFNAMGYLKELLQPADINFDAVLEDRMRGQFSVPMDWKAHEGPFVDPDAEIHASTVFGSEHCGHVQDDNGTPGYICTRVRGHRGAHIAFKIGGGQIARWPQADHEAFNRARGNSKL